MTRLPWFSSQTPNGVRSNPESWGRVSGDRPVDHHCARPFKLELASSPLPKVTACYPGRFTTTLVPRTWLRQRERTQP